jgi:hypothetical protein
MGVGLSYCRPIATSDGKERRDRCLGFSSWSRGAVSSAECTSSPSSSSVSKLPSGAAYHDVAPIRKRAHAYLGVRDGCHAKFASVDRRKVKKPRKGANACAPGLCLSYATLNISSNTLFWFPPTSPTLFGTTYAHLYATLFSPGRQDCHSSLLIPFVALRLSPCSHRISGQHSC